jgi:putative amidase-like protein
MKNSLKVSKAIVKTLCIMLLVLMVTGGFIEPQKALPAGSVPDNIKALLVDYSQYLNSGKTLHQPSYSASMETLVKDRRDYYNEFFAVGLHTDLTSIKSEFHPEDAMVTKTGNVYHVEVLEMVTMFGSPNLNSAEDYPMIPAAHWAISKTEDENVKKALEEYITNTTEAVNDSIINGVETQFRIKHKIDIIERKNGQMQFSKDIFTDKEIDNGDGVDNVSWINDHPSRSKPDLTQMPDYRIYHTSIEVLGQQLLDDYTKAYGGMIPDTTGFTYNRSVATNYAQTYSSEAVATTCTGIYQDTSHYNPTYQSIWNYTGCNDCTDFISQALRAGGFPPDSNWNYTPSPGTYSWRVFDFSTTPGLAYYLQTMLNAITVYSSNTSLQIGDLMYDNNLHVVMVTGTGPTVFSAHTNDRKNHAYMTVFNHYWHVKTNVP